jgi:hypothetical protein
MLYALLMIHGKNKSRERKFMIYFTLQIVDYVRGYT